jgi:hypothetical protein
VSRIAGKHGKRSRESGVSPQLTPQEIASRAINSTNAIDTNIFIYSVDRNEPVKQIKAQQLLQRLRMGTESTYLWFIGILQRVAEEIACGQFPPVVFVGIG